MRKSASIPVPRAKVRARRQDGASSDVSRLVSEVAGEGNLDELVPRLARDRKTIERIEGAVRRLRTSHDLFLRDARRFDEMEPASVHLVVTSPPYWTLKRYNEAPGQLGHLSDYAEFLDSLDDVWRWCLKALVPGGRLVCVVGDVCLARRQNNGRHTVVPLHAAIQERCRQIGFDNLAPIVWHKIANAKYEVSGNTAGFLGKPYEPNAVIKNDIEFILMQRKPGGYRSPTRTERVLSLISAENYQKWFRQIWSDISGASTRRHPAPFPLELAERIIRMFSFAGDTVLDPFMGTATTNLAAARWGRNSVGIEVDPEYFELTRQRLLGFAADLYVSTDVAIHC